MVTEHEATDVCVELLSSRLSIDILLLNTYSASGRRTVHLATTSPHALACFSRDVARHDRILVLL